MSTGCMHTLALCLRRPSATVAAVLLTCFASSLVHRFPILFAFGFERACVCRVCAGVVVCCWCPVAGAALAFLGGGSARQADVQQLLAF